MGYKLRLPQHGLLCNLEGICGYSFAYNRTSLFPHLYMYKLYFSILKTETREFSQVLYLIKYIKSMLSKYYNYTPWM